MTKRKKTALHFKRNNNGNELCNYTNITKVLLEIFQKFRKLKINQARIGKLKSKDQKHTHTRSQWNRNFVILISRTTTKAKKKMMTKGREENMKKNKKINNP